MPPADWRSRLGMVSEAYEVLGSYLLGESETGREKSFVPSALHTSTRQPSHSPLKLFCIWQAIASACSFAPRNVLNSRPS